VHRDLFDARFQLISEGREQGDAVTPTGRTQGGEDAPDRTAVLAYLDTPSDLLPGVYEGGLKTWECSLDVVEHLEAAQPFATFRGKRVLELGCGTAVPSLYILQRLFGEPEGGDPTEIHLQDYNESVLELMTFPNVFLAWYGSPASAAARQASESEELDRAAPGEVHIADELRDAFLASLKARNIAVRFFSGAWDTFDLERSGGAYDLLVTSETIYRTESLVPLTRLLDEGCSAPLSAQAANLALDDEASAVHGARAAPLCLVAAKVLYFGVGGGISEFVDFVENKKPGRKGRVETVLEKVTGVGRRVLSIQWA